MTDASTGAEGTGIASADPEAAESLRLFDLMADAARSAERRKVIAELEGLLFSLPRPSPEIPGLYRAVELVRATGGPGD
jgi:hypothetical protein